MSKPDLTYTCTDGMFTRFFPETSAGEAAWNEMAKADPDGAVAFLAGQIPGVLHQLRKAGYVVRKAPKHKPTSAKQLETKLADLDTLLQGFTT